MDGPEFEVSLDYMSVLDKPGQSKERRNGGRKREGDLGKVGNSGRGRKMRKGSVDEQVKVLATESDGLI